MIDNINNIQTLVDQAIIINHSLKIKNEINRYSNREKEVIKRFQRTFLEMKKK
jgi:hypothetical protein